jgi:hypothetical protein
VSALGPDYLVFEHSSPSVREGQVVLNIGLSTTDGAFVPVLEQGWPVPCHSFFNLALSHRGQQTVVATLVRGASGTTRPSEIGRLTIQVGPGLTEEVVARVLVGAAEGGLYARAHDPRTELLLPISWSPAPAVV